MSRDAASVVHVLRYFSNASYGTFIFGKCDSSTSFVYPVFIPTCAVLSHSAGDGVLSSTSTGNAAPKYGKGFITAPSCWCCASVSNAAVVNPRLYIMGPPTSSCHRWMAVFVE